MIRKSNFILLFIGSISSMALMAMSEPLGKIAQSSDSPAAELEDLFLTFAQEGTANDIQALLDQGLHPNNTLKEMPKFWEAISKRSENDKENTLPIIRTLINHAVKSLESETISHDNTNKKVIINMDVNGTIIFGGSSGRRTPEQSAILALVDDYRSKWDETINEPISFSEYINVKFPGSSADVQLKKKRDQAKFAFLTFLEETNHPLWEVAQKTYDKMVKQLELQQKSGNSVFNSFYKLIEYLEDNHINFSIILRSFGIDTDNVAAEVNKNLKTNFFKNRNDFRGLLRLIDILPQEERLAHLQKIYNFIKTSENAGIRDDYNYWNSNSQHQPFSKPLLIDNNDSSVIQIFFDDNVKSDPGSLINIVNPIDAETGESLDVNELIQNHMIVQVNGVQALLDENYFVNAVKNLLNNQ